MHWIPRVFGWGGVKREREWRCLVRKGREEWMGENRQGAQISIDRRGALRTRLASINQ